MTINATSLKNDFMMYSKRTNDMKNSLLKQNLKQTLIFSLLFLLFGIANLYAQDDDLRDCATYNCSAGDVDILRIYLTDLAGGNY